MDAAHVDDALAGEAARGAESARGAGSPTGGLDENDLVDEVDEVDQVDEVDEFEDIDEFEDVDTAQEPDTAEEPVAGGALTERERRVLAFERQWWKHAGSKEQAIRDLFDLSATRYYQTLNGLLDKPAALAHDPVLVKRLRRLRAARTRARSAGRVS
jgi:hypothetical protein